MAEIADLKPCPFCGGTDSTDNACQEAAVHPLEFKAPTGQRAYRVICACGAQSGADTNYFKATTAWNTRALDAKDKRIAELAAALSEIAAGPHLLSCDKAKWADWAADRAASSLPNKEDRNG